jgi:hypothetical protein
MIKTYEGFFKDLFKRKRESDGVYYWTDNEIEELEKIGFKRYSKSSIGSFNYKSNYSEKIETIKVSKFAEIINYNEYCFYEAYLDLKKIPHKMDFDSFYDMLKFIKSYITELDIDTKKYNL